MRDTLVVLNYQREIPPFMQTVLQYADAKFEKVLYVTPELYNDNRGDCHAEKLEVYQVPRRVWRKALCMAPKHLSEAQTRSQIVLSRKNGIPLKSYAKNLLAYNVCSDTLLWQVRRLVQQGKVLPERTVVLSAWFSVEAYAAVRLKRLYPAFRVVSYAHAFEIKEAVNPCAYVSYNVQKHEGCDAVVFISRKTKDMYLQGVKKLYPHLREDNIQVAYLGSIQRYPNRLSVASEDGILRIVSCSSAVSVKRIDHIIQALALCEQPVHWTHIGGGPLLESLKKLAQDTIGERANIAFQFLGGVSNQQVQEYYVTHPVDLFVNVSESEGLPVSIMEAMSYGIPVVATDVGGTGEIVTEQTGILLDKAFSPQELCDVLCHYAVLPQPEKESFRAGARKMWSDKFDGATNTTMFMDFLSEDADGKGT